MYVLYMYTVDPLFTIAWLPADTRVGIRDTLSRIIKGIAKQDLGGLQMILMDRALVCYMFNCLFFTLFKRSY